MVEHIIQQRNLSRRAGATVSARACAKPEQWLKAHQVHESLHDNLRNRVVHQCVHVREHTAERDAPCERACASGLRLPHSGATCALYAPAKMKTGTAINAEYSVSIEICATQAA